MRVVQDRPRQLEARCLADFQARIGEIEPERPNQRGQGLVGVRLGQHGVEPRIRRHAEKAQQMVIQHFVDERRIHRHDDMPSAAEQGVAVVVAKDGGIVQKAAPIRRTLVQHDGNMQHALDSQQKCVRLLDTLFEAVHAIVGVAEGHARAILSPILCLQILYPVRKSSPRPKPGRRGRAQAGILRGIFVQLAGRRLAPALRADHAAHLVPRLPAHDIAGQKPSHGLEGLADGNDFGAVEGVAAPKARGLLGLPRFAELLALVLYPHGWSVLQLQAHLIRAQRIRQGERIDAHRLQLRVGLEPVFVGGLTFHLYPFTFQHLVQPALGVFAVGNLQALALLQLGEILLHGAAARQIRPHLQLHAGHDALQIDNLGEIGGGDANGLG